ncbi:MAG: DMT family transporter [Geminicoccaceae bacterium]
MLLWSTGFIGARLGMPHAEPMTFLALRFGITAVCLAVGAVLWRAPWTARIGDWGHLAVAGLLMHGLYLGGVFIAIRLGLEAGLSALIVSLQPLLVAAAAPFILAERIGWQRWCGLGLGMLGAGLVLSGKLGAGAGFWAVAALLGITIGTLYRGPHRRRPARALAGSATTATVIATATSKGSVRRAARWLTTCYRSEARRCWSVEARSGG